jgi:protein-S-isoprenylcysteine O-methyltransferase Ste14
VKPLFGIFFLAVSAIWVGSEILLSIVKRSRSPDSIKQDRFSWLFIWSAIILSVTVGNILGWRGIGYIRAVHHWMSWVALFLILLGLGLRWTAILTLKRFFTVDLNIASDHQLVRRGVYRYLRHPSYAGSLLSFLGLGLAFSNWLSTLVIVVPITVALLYRIRIEEQALCSALGESYVRYALTTKRLIPLIY